MLGRADAAGLREGKDRARAKRENGPGAESGVAARAPWSWAAVLGAVKGWAA